MLTVIATVTAVAAGVAALAARHRCMTADPAFVAAYTADVAGHPRRVPLAAVTTLLGDDTFPYSALGLGQEDIVHVRSAWLRDFLREASLADLQAADPESLFDLLDQMDVTDQVVVASTTLPVGLPYKQCCRDRNGIGQTRSEFWWGTLVAHHHARVAPRSAVTA